MMALSTLSRRPRWILTRLRRAAGVTAAVALGGSLIVGLPSMPSALAASGPTLLPAAGQFVSVPILRVLDTRYGTGGVPSQPIPAGGTVTFPVTGTAGVPSGADSVVLDINALNPTAVGFLTVYNADASDPGVATVGMRASHMTNQNATVAVSSGGEVSLTNHSSGTTDVTASVVGYYTADSAAAAGATYFGVDWSSIANTSTGWKVPQAPIPAGGSLTFQVTGEGGIATGAGTAVLQVNALNASQPGYLTAYAAGTSDPGVSALAYLSDTYYRNLLYIPLSASGQVTLTNHGSAAVDVSVYARGYYMPPATTPAGGEYQSSGSQFVYGTATSGTQLAASASATFQVTGTGNVPGSGISGVTEDVVISNPTAMGRLEEGPAGGTSQAVVSFLAGDTAYAGYDNGLVSTLSPSGQETITNGSSGTVDVQVVVTGWFLSPTVPGSPQSVSATVSGTSATVTWAAPGGDGGSPVTGYTVKASSDSVTVTAGGTATQASLTGLANAATDSFTVTATNAVGSSSGGTFSPAQVITGTVTSANGTPIADEQVSLVTNDNDPTSAPVTPTALGTAITDTNGKWSFAIPSYASLPADAQAAATDNDGYLNVDAVAMGTATANGNDYVVTGIGVQSVWVGTATLTQAPGPADVSAPPAMVLRPDGVDVTAQYTQTAQSGTWSSLNNPDLTDSSGTIIGDGTNAYSSSPTDSYGFQEVVGDGSYNPNIAADGTDLTNAPVTANSANCCYINRYEPNCTAVQTAVLVKSSAWTIVGEYHTNWRVSGDLSYAAGATSNIGSYISFNGGAFSFNGYDTYTTSKGLSSGEGTPSGVDYDSRQISINLKYWETQWANKNANGVTCSTWKQWDEKGLYQPPGGAYIEQGSNMWGVLPAADKNEPWRVDGAKGLNALANDGHGAWLGKGDCGWHADLTRGRGITYGIAASVGGIGIKAETTHSAAVDQNANARSWTCEKRNDEWTQASDSWHYFWGYNTSLINYPKTFYLY